MVIRGSSDYCNGHKNEPWHRYAAAITAVYAGQFFFHSLEDGAEVRDSRGKGVFPSLHSRALAANLVTS